MSLQWNHTDSYFLTVVLICTHRPKDLAFLSLSSLQNQSLKNFRVFLINNGNNPDVKAVADSFMPFLDITYFFHNDIKAPGFLRTTYAQKATTPYVSFLDDDDQYKPHTIGTIYKTIQATVNDDIDFYQFGVEYINKNYTICSHSPLYIKNSQKRAYYENTMDDRITSHNSNKVFKTDIFKYLNPNDYQKSVYLEDGCIMLDILHKSDGGVYLINEILYNYYININQNTGIRYNKDYSSKKKILYGITHYIKKLKQYNFSAPLNDLWHHARFAFKSPLSFVCKIKFLVTFSFYLFPHSLFILRKSPRFFCKFFFYTGFMFGEYFYKRFIFPAMRYLISFYYNSLYFIFSLFLLSSQQIYWVQPRSIKETNMVLFLQYLDKQQEGARIIIPYEGFKVKDSLLTYAQSLNAVTISIFNPLLPYYMARAGVFLSTMVSYKMPFKILSYKIFTLQLWHGIPIKTIGRLTKERENLYLYKAFNLLISSSEADRLAMSLCFLPKNISRVHITGLPRYDYLLQKDFDKIPVLYKKEEEDLKNISRENKIIIYAPTWREDHQYYHWTLSDITSLKSLLVEHNAKLFIKPHQFTQKYSPQMIFDIIDGEIFVNASNYNIYSLMRYASVLITDYSSAGLDFLLTKKPIIHFNYDHQKYLNDRGFIYKEETAILPGGVAYNSTELLFLLKNQLQTPTVSARYKFLRDFFHTYKDTDNSQRVYHLLKDNIIKK